jgi:hypothetical protein
MSLLRVFALASVFLGFSLAQDNRFVMVYPREALNVVPQQGRVTIGPIDLSLQGRLPQGVTSDQLHWQPDWDGYSVVTPLLSAITGRSVSISITIPISAFSPANNFTVALRPRVFVRSISDSVAFSDWLVVTLASPPAAPAPRLLAGEVLLGFGATPPGKDVALHGQKIDVAKVDIDRPPLINLATNPSQDLSKDGLTESGGDAEDTALHPRNFTLHAAGTNGNQYAYAEFNIGTPDLIFHPLQPSAGATSDYDDRTKGIDGRRTDAPGEPVRIFTAIGARIVDSDSISGDGKYLIFTGPLGLGR